MLPGLYSAASGLDVAIQNQEVIAHNLAHLSVPGFRRSFVVSETFENVLQGQTSLYSLSAATGATGEEVVVDFQPGTYQDTGRKLDLAITGDGFFTVQGPDGPLYTRSGVFEINANGELVNHDGLIVLSGGGPLQFPANVSPNGVVVAHDGVVSFDGAEIGQLDIAAFDDPGQLIQAGTTLFQAPPGVVPGESTATIEQGVRELSNVSAAHELVRMIAGMRFYELSTRAMNSLNDAIDQNTDPQQGG